MKRVVGWVIGTAVVVIVLLVPAALYGFDDDEGTPYEPTSITRYLGDFDIGDDGDMDVVETITVDFPSGDRHGIFRFFDEADVDDDHVRWVPRDISVTMDGDDVPVAIESQGGGRYTVARIGDADVYVDPGEHVYEISYTMDGVLREGTHVDAETEFYWNLIPGGWLQTIDDARLTVHLPAAADEVECAVGTGAGGGCDLRGEGTETLQVRAGSLPAQTPGSRPAPRGSALFWPGGRGRPTPGSRSCTRRRRASAPRRRRTSSPRRSTSSSTSPRSCTPRSVARSPSTATARGGRSPTTAERRAGPVSTRSPPGSRTSSAVPARRSPRTRTASRTASG
jgi:hypothetical protein